MTGIPDPLTPAECDLRDFQYMELDVRVLRDSRFAAQVSGDAFRAGVLLWCAAWHQVPAGSLPDDDIELANLAGYGRFAKEWRKVRAEALTKFQKCSDGRLYHTEVCEKANLAWSAKLRHQYDKARERLRKSNKARGDLPPLEELTFDQWNERRLSAGIPMDKADASAGIPPNLPATKPGIPPENALKGNGEGTERERNGEGEGEGDYQGGLQPPRTPPLSADAADAPPAVAAKPVKARPKAKAKDEPAPSSQAWGAYAKAYAAKYGATPVRNAQVNAQLAQLVGRIGGDEAPAVAAFYLTHNNLLYVRAMHPVVLLLRDCEKLRTEWATNRRVTNAQATAADRTQTNANAFAPLIAEASAREVNHGIR